MPAISLVDLSYAHPDRTPVFGQLSLQLGPGLHGLVGRNGAGKTTLARLVAGELVPASGAVHVDGHVAYVPQDLLGARAAGRGSRGTEPGTPTLATLLGVAPVLEALARIEAGSTAPEDFDAVGDEWDVAEKAQAVVDKLGLPTDLARPAAALSGGERTLAAIAGALLARADVVVLDEPTNNLDTAARARLFAALDELRAGGRLALVVTHDLELLERVDSVVELRDGRTRLFGGTFAEMREALATEQAAAEAALVTAKQDLRSATRQRADAEHKNAVRARMARKAERERRVPKMFAGMRQDRADKAAGRMSGVHDGQLDAARDGIRAADERVRREALLRLELPDPGLPSGRTVLRAELPGERPVGLAPDAPGAPGRVLQLVGPERVRLAGPNGSGKSTFLRQVLTSSDAVAVPAAFLPQDLPVPPERHGWSVVDLIAAARPECDPSEAHAHAARLLFTGRAGEKTLGTLSGGERLRAHLAAALFARPVPQLLVLDEPTNNLDVEGVEQLAVAVAEWRGALLLVSHDEEFCRHVGLTREVSIAPEA